ncbi:MAG: sodium ion-translocating decarboxylase subunit beta [Defluviitaleaceae bacterium]|nr:sodium ion-translocating decarboxylase subunit beta [Defluviitaleaceae bacterium]
MNFTDILHGTVQASGLAAMEPAHAVMILISFVLMYLAIVKKFEPLLLLPIAFGMLLANIPMAGLMYEAEVWYESGILQILYFGVKSTLFPCLIFLCIGAMTDFGPMIANPSSVLLAVGAQIGIYVTFISANMMPFFSPEEAAAIAIIGSSDGPTAIYIATKLAPHLLAPIALAAYSYMALIPLIQPPVMKLCTTKKERETKMEQLRHVSKAEKICFPIIVTALCCIMLPPVTPLIGMFMLGNLFKESGVVDRLSDTAQNALCNIVTILLALTVGATASGELFLRVETLVIIGLGLAAFSVSTAAGVLTGKLMYYITGGKVNPLIGAAAVSAIPMAARVAQAEGRKANPSNFLLMHAMGPNVAGVLASAAVAGLFILLFS